jgi:hypothetical protein
VIDNFSLLLTHGLLLIMAWRLLGRADLDDDTASPGDGAPRGFHLNKPVERSEDAPGA